MFECTGLSYADRDINVERPSEEELRCWIPLSKLPIRKFFNTRGQSYRTLSVKDPLGDLFMKQVIALLAGNGMYVKRDLLIGEGFVLVGFNVEVWIETLKL